MYIVGKGMLMLIEKHDLKTNSLGDNAVSAKMAKSGRIEYLANHGKTWLKNDQNDDIYCKTVISTYSRIFSRVSFHRSFARYSILPDLAILA